MKRGVILFLCLATFAVAAQTISYWWEGMLRKPDAIQSQAYWIWPGSNIVFTYASNRFIINSTGGGGAVTNVGTNCFTFTAGPGLTVITSGAPCINVQYQTIGNLSNWMLLPTNAFEQACANLSAWCGIPTNGYLSGPVATQSFQAACPNLDSWCGIATNGYVDGPTVTNALNSYSNGILSVVPSSLWISNKFTVIASNGYANIMTNSLIVDSTSNTVFGWWASNAPLTLPYSVRTISGIQAKASVYGDLGIFDPYDSKQLWLWTQRTNYLQPAGNRSGGALIISNNVPGESGATAAVSMPASFMLINGNTNGVAMGWRNFRASGGSLNFYSMGVGGLGPPVSGGTNFYLFDSAAGGFVFFVSTNQFFGLRTNNPAFALDVLGDANLNGGQTYRIAWIPLTNIIQSYVTNFVTNYVQGSVSNSLWSFTTNAVFTGTNTTSQLWGAVTNLAQGVISNGVYGTGWHTNGNTIGTTKAFIGTLDNEGFEIRVNNTTTVVVTNGGLAVGTLVTNSGSQANCFGNTSQATASSSFAAGQRAESIGQACFAAGQNVKAGGVGIVGAFASGQQNVSSGNFSFSSGSQNTASGEGSFVGGEGSTAAGITTFAFGVLAVANNDGSFVWSDSNGAGFTDAEANKFVVGVDGGADFWLNTGGVGSHSFRIDGLAGTNGSFIALTGPSTYGKVDVHKGIITNITSVLYTNIFACLALTNNGQHLLLPAASTYQTVTNWHYVASNSITANPLLGHLTNAVAGYYRCTFSVSATPGNSDQIEADFATNGVPSDIIAAHGGTANPARDINLSSQGIVYLPANTTVSLMMQNVNSATLTVHHAQLTLGTP